MAHHNMLRKHHSEICGILDGSDVSLQSLTVSLYSEGIIDESTKHSVMRNKGIAGADELMNIVTKVVDNDPSKYLEIVLDTMEKVKILENVSQSIRDKISTLKQEEEPEEMSTSSTITTVDEEFCSKAVSLQDEFQEILMILMKLLNKVDIDRLKLKLNYHLKCVRENTPQVNEILSQIDDFDSPKKVLNCLIRSNLIGYLNYRLLDVFQRLINDIEVDGMISKYEEAHEAFLKSSDLETLAQLFLDYPELAPETFAGLPRFTVHLDKEWEKKSTYQWNQLLKTKFNHWPAHIHIVMITKKCIILEYRALPCDAPGIVRDLSDPQVLSTEGVTEIQLSDRLKKIGNDSNYQSSLDSQQLLPSIEYQSTTEQLLLKKDLIESSADREKKFGGTFVHSAVEGGNTEIVRLAEDLCGTKTHKLQKAAAQQYNLSYRSHLIRGIQRSSEDSSCSVDSGIGSSSSRHSTASYDDEWSDLEGLQGSQLDTTHHVGVPLRQLSLHETSNDSQSVSSDPSHHASLDSQPSSDIQESSFLQLPRIRLRPTVFHSKPST